MWYGSRMIPETFLALMVTVGPHPGRTLYSQTPVTKGAPLVALSEFTVDGKTFKAYRHLDAGEAAPYACTQAGNPVCRRPRHNRVLKRWERPETWREGLDRYWQISRMAAKVTKGDTQLAEFLYVVVLHESGNGRRDVHSGENHRPFRRRTIHEDAGRSWGLTQVMISRHPGSAVPMREHDNWAAEDLVGLDDASTTRGLTVAATRLRQIIHRCSKRGPVTPACVFVGYAGTSIKSTHPLMRARIHTHAKVMGASRELGNDVRKTLGLPEKKKRKVRVSVSFPAWDTSMSGPESATLSGSASTPSWWTAFASSSRLTSYVLPPQS